LRARGGTRTRTPLGNRF